MPVSSAAAESVPFADRADWKTDFRKRTVQLDEIQSGGPPKDGIPAVDRPHFDDVASASKWLKDAEPVVLVVRDRDARAYPLQILTWHEIVNDVVGGAPTVVTFCPLCNTAIAFERRFDALTLDFGTTGKLRNSDLVMYDRQTETWWQQITGEGIVGTHAGRHLEPVPAQIVAWRDFRAHHKDGKVLNRQTGFNRSYGRNPYAGYDDVSSSPFLFRGETDKRLSALERVVTIARGGDHLAVPFPALRSARVVAERVGGEPVVILWAPGTASALDAAVIADSRDVGAAGAFDPRVDGRPLTFRFEGNRFLDAETGSEWTVLGKAIAGPLAGRALRPIVHGNHFWFAWAAFRPQTRLYRP